ncbi:C40 family peptidase [Cytobacillus oceanisediminis]|uniref:C40 family peptidase n=1 Tax=Cytobacillus oceanisediminis TaxID=665099 RepID=UPI0015879906|nr:C40 family peptidase [Cytobacillus oceanisediminis]
MKEDLKSINGDIQNWYNNLPIEVKATKERINTQLLLGEPISVDDIIGEWAKIKAIEHKTSLYPNGYEGWIHVSQFTTNISKFVHQSNTSSSVKVINKTSLLKTNNENIELSFMTTLPLVELEENKVLIMTPDERYGRLNLSDVCIYEKGSKPSFNMPTILNELRRIPFIGGGASSYGFDCSGLTFRFYQLLGISIPRDVPDQLQAGISVDISDVKIGDLLFYCTDETHREKVNHVGIYMGNNQFLSARRTGLPTKVSHVSEPFYSNKLFDVRRYI